MVVARIDWTILWKLHHLRFFWIYFALAILLRGLLTWQLGTGSSVKKVAWAVLSSFTSSAVVVWFPILPLACGLMLNSLIGEAAGQSLFVSIPLVALTLTMGGEGALLDWVFCRILTKQPLKARFLWVFIVNMLNASIALLVALTWVSHHPTMMIANLL